MNVRTLLLTVVAVASGSAKDALVEISGEYAEYGMTVRADAGAPQKEVLLGSLLSLELEPASHRKWFQGDRRMRVTQYEGIAVEFYGYGGTTPDGGRTGFFKGNWTKADGLRVTEDSLILPRRPRPPPNDLWKAIFSFRLDEERRLIVTVDLTTTKKPFRTITGVYAFPRVGN